MKIHNTKSLLIILALLLASGCTPGEIGPTDPATEVVSISAAPTGVAEPTPSSTAPPVPTTTPYPTTPTPDPALPPWTREPSPTPTIQPTFAPIPGAVWPILFAGRPCIDGHSRCADIDSWDAEPAPWFQINSDGTGLRRVFQLDYPESIIQQRIRFSRDGSTMAYIHENGIYLADLYNHEPSKVVELPTNYWLVLGGFDFMENDACLLVYWRSVPQEQGSEMLSLQKACINQLSMPELHALEFPNLRTGSSNSYLNAQGDSLLTIGFDHNKNSMLVYITKLENSQTPILVFSHPLQNLSIGPAHWLPDGEHFEFLLNFFYPPDTIRITHYRVGREGERVDSLFTLNVDFVLTYGDWSPDGREIAYSVFDQPTEKTGIYIFDIEAATSRYILPEYYVFRGPFWSPEFP